MDNIFSDKNIIVSWIIVADTKISTYIGTLKSTNGRDIKSEDYNDTDINKLENILNKNAIEDFNQLKLERG